MRFSKSHRCFSLPKKHLLAKEAYIHVKHHLCPELVSNKERVLSYWLTEFIWDRFIHNEIRQLPGKWIYGYGYILLSEKYAYFVNLGNLVEKMFSPCNYTFCVFSNEPESEDIETTPLIKRIRYQELQFTNNNICQTIIDDKVWDIHVLADHEEQMAFIIAYKSALFGNIDEWFEPLEFN